MEFTAQLVFFCYGSQIGYACPKTISSKGACRQKPDGTVNTVAGYPYPPGAIQEFRPSMMLAVPKVRIRPVQDITRKGWEKSAQSEMLCSRKPRTSLVALLIRPASVAAFPNQQISRLVLRVRAFVRCGFFISLSLSRRSLCGYTARLGNVKMRMRVFPTGDGYRARRCRPSLGKPRATKE
jgi:hypothetical protein